MLDNALIIVLFCIILFQIIDKSATVKRLEQAQQHMVDQWTAERRDLMDRIQAPTFAEYTNKVVAEKKAEQPEEPQEEIEFVS